MKPRPCPPRQQRCADSTELLREYHGQRDHRLSTLPSTRPIRSWSLIQNGGRGRNTSHSFCRPAPRGFCLAVQTKPTPNRPPRCSCESLTKYGQLATLVGSRQRQYRRTSILRCSLQSRFNPAGSVTRMAKPLEDHSVDPLVAKPVPRDDKGVRLLEPSPEEAQQIQKRVTSRLSQHLVECPNEKEPVGRQKPALPRLLSSGARVIDVGRIAGYLLRRQILNSRIWVRPPVKGAVELRQTDALLASSIRCSIPCLDLRCPGQKARAVDFGHRAKPVLKIDAVLPPHLFNQAVVVQSKDIEAYLLVQARSQ